MKIIFLDVDGVLNSEKFFEDRLKETTSFSNEIDTDLDLSCFPLLQEIVVKTNAEVVLSSSWRGLRRVDSNGKQHPYFVELVEKLKEYGIKIFDYTKEVMCMDRSMEIDLWLKENNYIYNYVILDDELQLFRKNQENLVKINGNYGLQKLDVEEAIAILKKGDI